MALPNFVVVGAPKSGTTSLYHYLRQHPDVFLPAQKELHYFSYSRLSTCVNGPGDRAMLTRLCSTLEQYSSYYAKASGAVAIGDISPSYLYFSCVAVEIRRVLGPAKIIAILRDPVNKAYSQYMHLVRDGLEALSFTDALEQESRRREAGWSNIWLYKESSLYAEHLERYLQVFGQQNVLVMLFEDFSANPQRELARLFAFLGVRRDYRCRTEIVHNASGPSRSKVIASFLANDWAIKKTLKAAMPESFHIRLGAALRRLNTKRKPSMSGRDRGILKAYFKKDVGAIEKLLGRPVLWLRD